MYCVAGGESPALTTKRRDIMTRITAIETAITNAIAKMVVTNFNALASASIDEAGEGACPDAIDADLRAKQAINAGKFVKQAAVDAEMSVDDLRAIARRIFSTATAGRDLSQLARTIAMGHTLVALYHLGLDISDAQWSDVPAGMSLLDWEAANAA